MNAQDKWILILLLVPMIIALNWRRISNAFTKILSIALAMGVAGLFFSILNWSVLKELAEWIAGLVQINSMGTITPLICLGISVFIRAGQIFQETSATLKGILDKIPDMVEWGVIIGMGLIGGLAMAGSSEWLSWLDAWGEILPTIGNIIRRTGPLVGLG